MTKFFLANDYIRQYANHGQHSEQWVRYTLTGEYHKADNVAHNKGTDFAQYQIKSARATVCKGLDIEGYVATEIATEFIYATENGIAYVMTKEEYIEFVKIFGTVTRESKANGGKEKIRLKSESVALLEYLAKMVR